MAVNQNQVPPNFDLIIKTLVVNHSSLPPALIEILAEADQVDNLAHADQVREKLNQASRGLSSNARPLRAIQKAKLALAQKFPNTDECLFSTDTITFDKLNKTYEQVVILDTGAAYDLASLVHYHNARKAGEGCDRRDESRGKYFIDPTTHQPISDAATAHIFATIEKFNQDPSHQQKLKLSNVRGFSAEESKEDHQGRMREQRHIEQQAELLRFFQQRAERDRNRNRQPAMPAPAAGVGFFMRIYRLIRFFLFSPQTEPQRQNHPTNEQPRGTGTAPAPQSREDRLLQEIMRNNVLAMNVRHEPGVRITPFPQFFRVRPDVPLAQQFAEAGLHVIVHPHRPRS